MRFASASLAYRELQSTWRWPNFFIAELACGCGGRFCDHAYWHDPDFLDHLQELRDQIGKPLVLNSAHRCPQWNALIGGAPRSRHKRLAVDIALRGQDRIELLRRSQSLGFTGLGLAQTFLHLDRRRLPAIWFYPGSKKLWQI
ncbi:MAG: D-Ala-D-Ala carboxypeptidase family metallohydrolase [Pseudomonadota bacterium]